MVLRQEERNESASVFSYAMSRLSYGCRFHCAPVSFAFRRDDEDLSGDVLSPMKNELNSSSRDSVREFYGRIFFLQKDRYAILTSFVTIFDH